MNINIKVLFSLITNALFDTKVDEETRKETIEQIKDVYGLAKYHDVSHLVSYAIVKNEIEFADAELYKKLKKRHAIAALRYETANYDFCRITELFEKEKIPFIPLKGAVMRDYYPEPWMRTSCDIDVLVREEDLANSIALLTEKCGYTFNEKGTHDVSLFSPNETHVELHFKLSEDLYNNDASGLISKVWDYASLKDGFEYWYVLADEFFYLYHIYHMAKHFEVAGCGIKPYVDLYILDKQVPHDERKRTELLENSGLLKFTECCRRMNECWFEGVEMDKTMRSMQAYVVTGGTYGNKSNSVAIRQSKSGGKVRYILDRLFLPYEMLKVHYPVLNKHKYLTPFFEVVRWFRMFSPSTFKRTKSEMKHGNIVSDVKNEKLSNLLTELGLK